MKLQIECADKNGDVFIDLVDRSSPRHPKLIATMERGFDMKENAQVIANRVNAFEEGGLVDELRKAFGELAATFVGLPEGSIGGQALKRAKAALAKS